MNEESVDRAISERLLRERPLPGAAYRGSLRRHLLALEGGSVRRPRPSRLGWMITAYGTSGAALLVIAAVGVLGAGPLAGG